jgi:hypothetical protein
MYDNVRHWKCPQCQGTGKKIAHDRKSTYACEACDGTGNAFVDGAARRYQREIDEIERNQRNLRASRFLGTLPAVEEDWDRRVKRTQRLLASLPYPTVRRPHA